MSWGTYAVAVLAFNAVGFVVLYGILRLQGMLPVNPDGIGPMAPDLAFNTAASFVTNTNWQAYSGEAQLSYLSQMAGLTVQNFVSAGKGMAVAIEPRMLPLMNLLARWIPRCSANCLRVYATSMMKPA